MKPFKTLVKFHKKQIDDILLQISALETQKNQILNEVERILQEYQKELGQYSGRMEYCSILDQYMIQVRKQEKSYKVQIKDIESTVEKLRDDLLNRYAELKKFEIILKRKTLALKQAEEKKENDALDELTVLRYKRA